MQTVSRISNKSLFKNIFLAGVVAGALDGTAAIINFYISTGKNPVIIFVYIASGMFGREAYTGSQSIAIIGLFLHFLIAIIFSAFYFWIYPKVKFLHQDKLTGAVLYGIFVWLIMNGVVVPLSNTPPLPFQFINALLAVFILIVCVGMPVSFIAASYYKKTGIPDKSR